VGAAEEQGELSAVALPAESEALARYLDRMRSAYPGGIPRALLVARAVAPQAGAAQPPAAAAAVATTAQAAQRSPVQVTFIVVGGADPLPQEQVELLKAITEKGLRIRSSCSTWHCVPSPDDLTESITALIKREQPRLVLVLGAAAPDGRQQECDGSVVLHSHPLQQIQDDAAVKREFWGHLRSVLGVVSA
jgi:hypothetical protein